MLELAILKLINCSKLTNILLVFTKKILDKKTHGYNFLKFLVALCMFGLDALLDLVVTGLLYFFYLKKYLFKFFRVLHPSKNLLNVLVTSHIDLLSIKNKLLTS